MPPPAIAFIVPIHNRWDLAEPLLRSLPATAGAQGASRCVIVDDASTPEVRAALDELPPPFRVLHNDEQLGFGRSVNRAIASVDEPFVAILNSDLVLSPGWLEPMLDVLDAKPEAFAVGNIQRDASTGAIDHAGIVFHEEGFPIHFRPEEAFIQAERWREFPAATAACLIVRRERFLQLGGFDDAFRNGFEDIDLCLRARMRGWPTFVAHRSQVGHHISASPGRKDHEAANARRFLERWRPLTSVWQRDWENRLLRARRARAGELPPSSLVSAPRDMGARALRVMVDLARLAPEGANGGIKVLVRESLRALHERHPDAFTFVLIVPEAVASEAIGWIAATDEVRTLPAGAGAAAWSGRVRPVPGEDTMLARVLAADVLYCPLGVSDFLTPDIPVIGVAVDLLHREHPECLSPADVSAREAWFDRMVCTSFRIQCNSAWVADRVSHHFGAGAAQLFVVHNAVHDRLGPPVTRSPAARAFYYPANAWPHKNHDTLLVAYRLYRIAAGPRAWPLLLTGHADAAMRRLVAHARALGLADCVEFRGFVPAGEQREIWSEAGALVFPSLHEGFGIPLLEAMHHGVPIVAAATGAVREVVGDACLDTDLRDPAALARALGKIADDPDLRASLTKRGRERARAFSFPAEIDKLAGAFRDAVGAFRSAGITWQWDTEEAAGAHRL